MAAVRDGQQRTGRVPSRVGPTTAPDGRPWSEAWLRDLSPATLASLAVGLVVLVVAGALTIFHTPPRPELPPPLAGEAIKADPTQSADPDLPPTVSYSPAPVSLSTRASMPPRPSHRPTPPPSRKPSPKPSPSSPTPPTPRPDELTPLPPAQEPNLRSTGGGPETFIDFVNARAEAVIVDWLDYDGRRQQYAVLQPGQSYRQQTYLGHPWVVTNGQGVGLVCFQPADRTMRAVIR
ncbi:hypothetical protein MRQ36_14925 [Micromonospora sp. R77]|uniref:VHL beta domain-containing protein n=1 Tax=Micromonospora sp. R77 TaxID=2925836 RepID=UPI001F607306|nr:hypothetical protein [Micromonospora sp. R77]MCI4063810.1 hypothetical protein [Micromonospora sp. R77]